MVEPDVDLYAEPEPGRLNPGRLWAGGVATAVVAALVVIAGVYIARGILGIPVLAPKAAGSFGSSVTAVYAAVAAAGALLATGLLHILLLETPRPLSFFTWITALADLILVVAPFSQPATLPSKVFTAVINLVAGVAVIWACNPMPGGLRGVVPRASRVQGVAAAGGCAGPGSDYPGPAQPSHCVWRLRPGPRRCQRPARSGRRHERSRRRRGARPSGVAVRSSLLSRSRWLISSPRSGQPTGLAAGSVRSSSLARSCCSWAAARYCASSASSSR